MSTPDSFDGPHGRTCSAPETAGQAAYEAFAKAIPEDVFPEHLRDMGWTDWRDLRDHERPAWEAAAQAAIAAAAPAPAGEGGDRERLVELLAAIPFKHFPDWGYEYISEVAEHQDNPQPQAAPDHARAETAAIKAAAANTARELAEVTAERDALRELVASGEPLTVKPADDVKAAPELAAAMAETRRYREGLEHEIAQLETSARISQPSKKSEIEKAVAKRLRKLLGQP